MVNTCNLLELPKLELGIIRSHGIASLFPENFAIENNFSENIFVDYYRNGGDYWIHLFHRHDIKKLCYDAFVDRGYTGPITNMSGSPLSDFLGLYMKYKRDNNFVCELFKPHPLMEKHGISFSGVDGIYIKNVCYIDEVLSSDFPSLINGKNRNILKKSHRSGNHAIIDLDIDRFIKSYNLSMVAKSTSKNYFIDPLFSSQFINDSSFILSVLDLTGEVVASGLFFLSDMMMEYGLSYVSSVGRKTGAGVHLIEGAYNYCKLANTNIFYLGGGVSSSDSDPLYKFKKSLSNRVAEYHIFPVIYDDEKYQCLVENKPNGNLLSYRGD